MNHLYEAIVGLGRSWDAIRRGEWRTAGLGDRSVGASKCAIGHISYAIIGSPLYLTACCCRRDVAPPPLVPDLPTIMWLMADAVRKCVTQEMYDHAYARTIEDSGFETGDTRHVLQRMEAAMRGSDVLDEVQVLIVRVNDSLDDKEQAARWFSDAIDLLVDQLLPAMPNYRYCKACQQGLGWDGATEHVDGCPDKALALV